MGLNQVAYTVLTGIMSAVGRGVVAGGATTTSVGTTSFVLGYAIASGVVVNQFVGRTLRFDGNTTTAGLQGARGIIIGSSASNTPDFTLQTALPATPVAGDTFSIV